MAYRKTIIEYQVVFGEGEDVDSFETLKEAKKIYKTSTDATELRKIIWKQIKDFHGKWIPLTEEAEREEKILAIKEK